jgi:hypothetical protein
MMLSTASMRGIPARSPWAVRGALPSSWVSAALMG